MSAQAKPICGATTARCMCVLEPGHPEDQPHVCNDTCRGSWKGDRDLGTFEVVLYPGGYASALAALAAAFGMDVP